MTKIERVARAICVACEEYPDHRGDARGNEYRWQDYKEVAEAAIRAVGRVPLINAIGTWQQTAKVIAGLPSAFDKPYWDLGLPYNLRLALDFMWAYEAEALLNDHAFSRKLFIQAACPNASQEFIDSVVLGTHEEVNGMWVPKGTTPSHISSGDINSPAYVCGMLATVMK